MLVEVDGCQLVLIQQFLADLVSGSAHQHGWGGGGGGGGGGHGDEWMAELGGAVARGGGGAAGLCCWRGGGRWTRPECHAGNGACCWWPAVGGGGGAVGELVWPVEWLSAVLLLGLLCAAAAFLSIVLMSVTPLCSSIAFRLNQCTCAMLRNHVSLAWSKMTGGLFNGGSTSRPHHHLSRYRAEEIAIVATAIHGGTGACVAPSDKPLHLHQPTSRKHSICTCRNTPMEVKALFY